jgi:hypothetical protein
LLDLEPDSHVLEDFIESMAEVEVAVRVRGSIMENEGLFFRAIGCLPCVEEFGASEAVLGCEIRGCARSEPSLSVGRLE